MKFGKIQMWAALPLQVSLLTKRLSPIDPQNIWETIVTETQKTRDRTMYFEPQAVESYTSGG